MASLNPARYRRLLKRLRAAREEAGLSTRAASSRLRQSSSFVSKCETGERRIDPIELEIFARLYGKPVGYFYGQD